MFGPMNFFSSVAYYAKTAILSVCDATVSRVKNWKFNSNTSIFLATDICVNFVLGGTPLVFRSAGLLILAGLNLPPILIESRENYVKRLFADKIKCLSPEDRKLFEEEKDKPFEYPIDKNSNKKEEDFKVPDKIKPTYFEARKDGRSFYFLGVSHTSPLSKLPDFIHKKIKQFSDFKHALTINECDRSNAQYFRTLLMEEIKQLFSFNGLRNMMGSILHPWYLRKGVDSRLANVIIDYRNGIYNTVLGSFLVYLMDFIKPGRLVRGYLLIRHFSLYVNSGMDSEIDSIFKGNHISIISLEGISDIFDAVGLRSVDKLDHQAISDLCLAHSKCQLRNSDNGKLEEAKLFYNGDLVHPETYEHYDEAAEEEGPRKILKEKLKKLGVDGGFIDLEIYSNKSLAARNLNWFPQLKLYMEKNYLGFIYFGAAHLGGQLGILNLLQQDGYEVRRMTDEYHSEREQTLEQFNGRTIELKASEYFHRMNKNSLMLYQYHDTKGKQKRSSPTPESPKTLNITSNGKIRFVLDC